MTWPVLLVFAIGGLALVGAVVKFVEASQGRRRDPEPQRSSLDAIEDRSIVTITGTVCKRDSTLVAPLSARTCVAWEVHANLFERSRALIAQIVEQQMVPFELVTPFGAVRIDGTEADSTIPPTPVLPRRHEREAAFLREHDRDPALIHTSDFAELTISEDMLIAVQGMAIVEGSTIRLVANGEQPLQIGPPRRMVVVRNC